jgi:hypothetical protein
MQGYGPAQAVLDPINDPQPTEPPLTIFVPNNDAFAAANLDLANEPQLTAVRCLSGCLPALLLCLMTAGAV